MVNRLLFLFLVVFYSSYGFSQGGFEGAISKKEGSSREDFLEKFSDSLGNETTLPGVVFHGNEEGPVFTIVAGVHGFEYPPIVAAQELLREIDPMQLRGTLIFIPIANKGSFYSRTPFLNALDKKNLNGVFPGNKKGTVTEKIAHFISTKIIPLSDIFMDMHGGDASEDLLPFVCYYNNKKYPEQTQKARALSERSGFQHIVSYDYNLKEGQPSKYAFKEACQQGKVALSFESGKLGNVQEESVRQNKKGIYRILNELGMYKTTFQKGLPQRKQFNKQQYIKSSVQGIFYSDYKAGDRVLEGEIVGLIKDEFGRILKTIKMTASGTILYKVGTPPVNVGETLMCIGYFD